MHRSERAVCTENSNPDVMVMKFAKDWRVANDSGRRIGREIGASLSNDRYVLISSKQLAQARKVQREADVP
jgi:hypothetical protein